MFLYLVFLFVFHCASSAQDFSRCPSNIQRGETLKIYETRCYEFMIHRHQNWEHAKTDCKNKDGNLLTIHNIKVQNFIVSALRSLSFQGKGVWIGLNDKDTETKFVWDSGERVDFTYWGQGEPGNIVNFLPIHHEEDCVLLKYSDSGHWHDYPCNGILFALPENDAWICQYDMIMPPSTSTTTTTTTAPTNTTIAPTGTAATVMIG